MNYIEAVKERVNLKEGEGVLEKFLSALYFHGPLSTKSLARSLSLPIPVTSAIKKEFIKLDVAEQKSGVQLTGRGRLFLENDRGYAGIDKATYLDLLYNCGERGRIIDELCDKYADIFDNRPTVDVTIDQAKCTVQSAFKRAALCLENHSLIGKRVLCVGDDDFVSVAIGLLMKRLFPGREDNKTELCVFEIDKRYIDYINEISLKHKLRIECAEIDLRDPLPLAYSNSFDCFFADPPYTIEGLSLFLSRGISALKNKKGLKAFLSFGQKPVNESFLLQECILKHGFVIRNIFASFNQYEGASLLGNESQMIVLESAENLLRPMIPSGEKFFESIYTGEKARQNSEYVCKNCGQLIAMRENEQYDTIEKLKLAGCPFCGGLKFDLKMKKPQAANAPKERKALGEHILADFYDCGGDVLNDPELVKEIMLEAAKIAKAAVIFEKFHKFSPWGVSGAIIIKESHLTIHTWPEHKYAAVDLFTCSGRLEIWRAFEHLKEKFQSGTVEYNDISRGAFGPGANA